VGLAEWIVVVKGEPISVPGTEFARRNVERPIVPLDVEGEYKGKGSTAVREGEMGTYYLSISGVNQDFSVRLTVSCNGSKVVFSSQLSQLKDKMIEVQALDYITATDGQLRKISTQRIDGNLVLLSQDHVIGRAEQIIEGVKTEADAKELVEMFNDVDEWTGTARMLKGGYFSDDDKEYHVDGTADVRLSSDSSSLVRYGVEYDETITDEELDRTVKKGISVLVDLTKSLGYRVSDNGWQELISKLYVFITTSEKKVVFLTEGRWKYQFYRMLASHVLMRDPKRAVINGTVIHLANIGPTLRCEQIFVPTIRAGNIRKWCAFNMTLPSLRFYHDKPPAERQIKGENISVRKRGRGSRDFIEGTSRPAVPDKTSPWIPILLFTFSAPVVLLKKISAWHHVWWEGTIYDYGHIVANSIIEARDKKIETYQVRLPWGGFCVCRTQEIVYDDEKTKVVNVVEKNIVFPTMS